MRMTAPKATPAAPAATPASAGKRAYLCPACGTPLTYGASRCGACAEEAPVYNHPAFWRWMWICLGLGLAILVTAVLL